MLNKHQFWTGWNIKIYNDSFNQPEVLKAFPHALYLQVSLSWISLEACACVRVREACYLIRIGWSGLWCWQETGRETHTSLHHIRHCGSGASHAGTPARDLWSHTHTHRRQSDSSLNSDTFTAVKFFIFWMDAHPVLPVLFTLGINIRFKQSVWHCMPNTHPNGVQNIWPTCTIHVQPNFCVCAAVCVDVWVIWALRKKDPCASICTHGQWSLLSKACLFN